MKSFLLSFLSFFLLTSLLGQAPTVVTNAPTSIEQLRAQGSGTITSNGGPAIIIAGLVWDTVPSPKRTRTYWNWREGVYSNNTTKLGSFTNTYLNLNPIAPLLPNRTYYVRAFAIYGTDTAYGNEVSFTTLAVTQNKKWYFSASGNDNNNGLSPATPFKTLAKLHNLATGGRGPFQPGDTIFFKRGDVFDNGINDYLSVFYWNRPYLSNTANSGTPGKPIVFTNYGDPNLPLPNFLTPASRPPSGKPICIGFAGVKWIVVDGLQFNDTRFPVADKINPSLMYSALGLGEYIKTSVPSAGDTLWGSNRDDGNRNLSLFNFTLQNCFISNVSYGITQICAFDSKITRNTITNLKTSVDTFGTYDAFGSGIGSVNGKRLELSYNYIKGAWGRGARYSSTQGMGGIAMDIFNFQDSKIIYNTIVDCSGFLECGGQDLGDVKSGMYNDTIAYNKILNCFTFITLHLRSGDPFVALQYNIRIWNNIQIENNNSRFTGNRFGDDIYGDGQSFKNFPYWGVNYLTTGYNTVKARWDVGTNIISGIDPIYSGIKVGGWVYAESRSGQDSIFVGGPKVYAIITGVNLIDSTVTIDRNFTRSNRTNLTAVPPITKENLVFFPPISEKGITWSQPNNPSSSGYYGRWDNNITNTRQFLFATGPAKYGNEFDTCLDIRNNIIWGETGLTLQFGDTRVTNVNGTRIKRANNIYYVSGSFSHTFPPNTGLSFNNITKLDEVNNTSLKPTERLYTGAQKIFKNTTPVNPELWDFSLVDTSYGINGGAPTPGITKDFSGVPYSGNATIGLIRYSPKPQVILVSSSNVTCKTATNGSITVSASGGSSPYTYRRGTLPYQSSPTFTGLAPGTYPITVKDSKGLTSSINVTIKSSNVTCP